METNKQLLLFILVLLALSCNKRYSHFTTVKVDAPTEVLVRQQKQHAWSVPYLTTQAIKPNQSILKPVFYTHKVVTPIVALENKSNKVLRKMVMKEFAASTPKTKAWQPKMEPGPSKHILLIIGLIMIAIGAILISVLGVSEANTNGLMGGCFGTLFILGGLVTTILGIVFAATN